MSTSEYHMTNSTAYRDTPRGVVVLRGKRELHLLGTSVEQTRQIRHLLATRSFDSLFKSGRCAPQSRNVAYIRIGA